MSIGRIIYFHRKKQQKTQEQLCQGICSVTHLSKIENNFKEAHSKTLEMLCDRLQISIEKENDKMKVLKQKLELFYDMIERLYKDRAETLYKELLEEEEYVQFTELIYVYKLYMLRYFLFLDKISEFEQVAAVMKSDVTKYSPYELYIWELLEAIYLGQKGMFAKSLEVLKCLEDKAEQYSEKISEYYYYRSTAHGHLYQYSLSLYYANKALRNLEYKTNLLRIVYIKMNISVNLIRLGEFDSAEQMLFLIQSDSYLLEDNDMKISILHNLGLLYNEQKKYEKALNYYERTLQLIHNKNGVYYSTVIAMAQVYIGCNQPNNAVELLKKEIDVFEDRKSTIYIKMNIVYLEALGCKKELIQYIISTGLPILEQNMEFSGAIRYINIIITYYEEKNNFTAVNRYLRKSNMLLQKCLLYY